MDEMGGNRANGRSLGGQRQLRDWPEAGSRSAPPATDSRVERGGKQQQAGGKDAAAAQESENGLKSKVSIQPGVLLGILTPFIRNGRRQPNRAYRPRATGYSRSAAHGRGGVCRSSFDMLGQLRNQILIGQTCLRQE